MNKSSSLTVYKIVFFCLFLLPFIPVRKAIAQAGNAVINATDPRHETLNQRLVSVLFDQNILSATTAGWAVTVNTIPVTINSVGVLGNRVNITFDATPAHAAQNFLIPGDVVRVSYNAAAALSNTLTATAGNPEVNSFGLSISKNNWLGDCSDLIFFQIGDYAAPDICSPVNNNFKQVQYYLSLRLRNSSTFTLAAKFRYSFLWGDGSPAESQAGFYSDGAGLANASFFTAVPGFPASIVTSRATHLFPDNTNVCNFTTRIFPLIVGVANCNIGSLLQQATFISYDLDNQNTGALSMIPSIPNSNLVCIGNNVNMRFSDATTLNCVPDVPAIGAPNILARWIRIVYGFQNAVAPGNIPNIRVNGPLTGGPQNVTNGAGVISPVGGYFPLGGGGIGFPDANGVIELATPVSLSTATTFMQTITTSSTVGQVVDQRFWVRLDYWNTCNPYNPGDLSNLVSTTNFVRIIDSPNPPAVNNPNVCENTGNGSYNITATGVGAGALTYTWYLDAGLTTVLQGPLADNTFNPVTEGPVGNRINTNVAVSTTFNRYVTVTQGSNNCTSQPQTITIRIDALNTPGSITHPLGVTPITVCSGTDPAPFISSAAGTGGGPGGTFTYQWQSATNAAFTAGVTTVGANSDTFDPPAVTATIFYRRNVISGNCATVSSNIYEFRADTPVLGGSIGASQTKCEVPGDPDLLTNTGSPTGGSNTGVYNFQWEESTVGVAGPFNTIAGATTNTYNPPAGVTTTTHYRRRVNSGVCSVDGPDAGTDPDNIAYSNVVTVTINQIVNPGSIGNAQTICSGQDPAILTSTAAPSGGDGSNYTFQWQESATGGGVGFAAAPGANTGATYDPPVLVATRFYRRQVTSGVCSPTFSNEIQITVNALPTVVLSGGGSICSGNPAPDVVFTFTGAGPWDLVYSINGTNQPVVNNTTSPFTLVNPAAGVYAVVSINDSNTPNCLVTAPNANITGGATVTIQATPPPTVETFTATAAVCDDGGATNPPDAILDLLPNSAQFYDITYTVNGNTFTELNKASDASGRLTLQPLYTAWGSVPGSHVVTVTALKNTVTLCAGAVPFNSAPLVVNPRPALPAGPVNGIACSVPGTGVALSVTDPGAGFEIEWSTGGPNLASFAAAVPGSGAESGTNNRTFTPTTSATATFYAFTRNTATGCFSSTGRAVTQTQDLRPNVAAAGPDQPLLCNTSATLAATAVNNGGTGAWSVVGPVGSIVITTPSSPTSTVTGLPQDVPGGSPIVTTLRWTASSALGVCSPSTDDVILTVNPRPAVTNLTPQLCEDVSGGGTHANFNLTTLDASVTGGAPGVTVEWFADPIPASPILPATTLQNITNGAGGSYFVRLTNAAGCQNTGTVTFTVNTLPAAVDRNFQFCENTVGAGIAGNFVGNTINLTTFEFGAGGVTNGGTAVTRDVEWYEDAALTTLISPGAGVGQEQNYTIAATKTIFAKVTDLTSPVTPKCFDVADVTLTLKLRPADNPITGSATVCTGSTIVLYQVNPGLNPGSNYTWSVTSAVADFQVFGGGGINSPNFFILLKFPGPAIGNVDISVFETLNGCDGNTSNFSVTVAGAPGALTFNSPQTNVCKNQTGVVYSLNAPNPLSLYTWTAPGASFQGPSSGVGLSSVTLDFTTITPVTISVTETSSSGCAGSPAAVVVNLVDRPVMTSSTTTSVCSGNAPTLAFTATLGGLPTASVNFGWQVINVTGAVSGTTVGNTGTGNLSEVLTNTSGVIGTVTYRVTPTETVVPNPPNCAGTPQDVVVTINPAPVLVTPQTKTICSNQPVNHQILLTPATLPVGTVFNWGLPTMSDASVQGSSGVNVAVGATPHITDVLVNFTTAPITATYLITPSNAGCPGTTQSVVITINPQPVGAADTKTICSNTTVSYNLQATNIDILGNSLPSTFSWIAASNPSVTGESTSAQNTASINDNLRNVTNLDQLVVYTITPTGANGCAGSPFTVSITVKPEPVGAADTKTICSNAVVNYDLQVSNLNTLGNGLASTFSWVAASTANVSGESTSPQLGATINDLLINTTSVNQTVTYTVTPTSSLGLCTGGAFTVTLTVQPQPVGVNDVANTCSDVVLSYNLQNNINTLGNAIVSTFSWVAAANGNVSGESTTPKVTGTINDVLNNVTGSDQVVVYTVTPTSGNGCAGNPFTVSVTVKSEPLGAADVKTICSDASVGYNLQVTNLDILGNSQPSTFSWVAASNLNVTGESTASQAGGTITDILNNVTATDQTVNYTVTPTGVNGCIGNPFTITVTVQPEPLGVNSTKTICSDASVNYDLQVTNIDGLGNGLASTFTWAAASNPDVSGESTAPQAGSTINDVLNNVTSIDQVVVYTVTPTSSVGGCVGNPFTISVTVRPEPVGVNDVANTCSDVVLSYNLQNNINTLGNAIVSTFSWVAAANGNVSGESTTPKVTGTINDVLNNVTGSDQVVVYTVTPTSGNGCAGNPFTVSVTVKSEPLGAADVKTICSDASVGYNLQVTNLDILGNSQPSTFSWVAASNLNVTGESTASQAGGTITDILNNVTATDQTVNYTVTPTGVNGCIGNPFTITVTVQPEPLGVNSTKTICSDASVNYDLQVTNIDGLGNGLASTFTWAAASNPDVSGESTAPQAGSTINDVLNNVTSIDQVVVYTVTPTSSVGGCVGNPFTISVTVRPEPVGVNDVANTCSDVVLSYNLQNNINTLGNAIVSTFSWVAAANGNVSGESTTPKVTGTINDVLNNVTGSDQVVVYTVTPTSGNGCAGNPFTVSVTVKSEPLGAADVKTICSDASVGYNLQVTNLDILGNSQPSTFSWVAASNASVGGESTTPQVGSTITDILNNVTTSNQTVVYTVTPTGTNGCIGNPFVVTITVQPEPVGANATMTICSDGNVNYDLQVANINSLGNSLASTFSWVAASNTNVTGESTAPQAGGTINDVLNNVTNSDQIVVYTVTPTSTGPGCIGNPFTVSVTVRPEPVGGADVASVCSDVALTYNLQNNVTSLGNGLPATFSWVAASNLNVGGESIAPVAGGTINDVLNNVTGSDQVVVYTITPTSTFGCLGNPFVVSITVRSEPVGAADTKTICSDASVNYNLQTNVTSLGNGQNANFTWVATSNANVSGESTAAQVGATITDILNNVTNLDQVVTYTVTPTGANGCPGNPFTINITVQPEPVGMNDTKTICGNLNVNYDLQNNINVLGNGLSSSFSWVATANPNVSGESTTSQVGSLINDLLVNVTNADQNVVYTATPAGINGCDGNLFTITVTVRPQPIGVNDTKTVCSDISIAYDLQNNINVLGNALPSSFSWVAASNGNVTGESTSPVGGPIITDVINNVTGADETVVYTVTPTSTLGCIGAPFTVSITVRSEPVGVADAITICSDVNVSYSLQNNINTLGNGIVSGFSWIAIPNANVTGESTSAQATGTINDVVTNVTSIDQQVIYTVTPTGINGCIGNPFLITVTVRPEPVGVNDTKTICSDAIVNYNLTSNVNTLGNNLASTFSWVATANINVTGESTLPQVGSIITDALNNVSGIDQTVVYTITPTSNDGCVGNTFTVSITVQSEPVGLADVKAVCSDSPVNYALQTNINILGNNVVSTFSWIAAANANVTGESSTAQAGGTITDVLNNVTGADEIVVYTVTPTSSTGCAGNPFVITVTVRPEPVGGSDTKTICSDATVNYDLTNNVATLGNNLGANFSWVAAANGSVSGESVTPQAGAIITDLLNNVSGVDQVVVYTITPTGINGCVGNPFTVSVTVQSEPIGLADGVSICSDQNVAYDLQNNVNTLGNNVTSTFNWQAAANPSVTGESTTPQAGGIISDILSNISGVSQVVDYTVTPTGANGCPGNPFLVSVTVRSEPLGVNDAKSICSDDNVNYDLQNNISSLGNSVTSTFSWIAATNPNVSGESTTPKTGSIINDVLNNVSNIDELVTYTITPTGANGCLGNLFTVTITVQPEPKGLNDVATINSDIALAYDLQNNVNTLGNGLAASFSWVAASNGNVSGESTTPQAGGFINDILNNVSNANQTVIYTVTPTGANSCMGNTFQITVTVLPEPVGINDAVTVNSDVTVNYNLQTNVNSLGNGLPSTFSWVAAPNPNVTGESAGPQSGPIITDVITNITGIDQVVIYTVTPTGTNGVLGDPFTITVTVRSEPLGADDTKTICSDATVAYDLQNNINTLGNGVISTFTWVAASNTNVSGESTTLQAGSVITDVLNNVTNADQLVFYTVIPTGNNSVVGNPFTITVVVQPEPVIDPALASKTICSRDITNITLNTDGVSVAAVNYNISLVSQDAGLIGVPTTGNGLAPNAISNNSFINLTSTPLKVVYQIVPISAVGCVGNPFNITLTVNAEPVVNTALDNSVCSQEISNIILSTNGTSVAASSYQLVSVTVPGTITADGSNAVAGSISSVNLIRNDKYTNNTSGPVIVIYEIVGISPSGCIGQSEFVNLTVNPAPIMIPGTANLCSDVPSGIIVGPAAGSATITQFELKNVVKAPALVAGGSNVGLGIYAANLAGGQSDFLSNDTFTNTTNGPLIVTYTVVPIAAGCRGLDQTVVFTVNPAPAVDDNLNKTVCSDGAAGIVFATETAPLSTAAASYNIVSITVQPGLVRTAGNAVAPRNGVSANDIQADQFRNPTNDPLTVTYGVQAVSGSACLGPIRNIILTVEPEIIAAPVNNAPTICSNSQTDIDLISPTNPTSGVVTFNYTAVSSVGGLISGFVPSLNNLPENYKIQDALVNNSDNPATVTYSISAVANGARNGAGCSSLPPAVTIVVTVDPKPKLVASPSIQTVCEGVATSVTLNSNTVPSVGNVRFELLSATATGGVTGMSAVGTLFAPASSLADVLNNPTVTSQTVTYTFQPKVIGGLGCAGDNVVVTITVNPLPTIVASAQPDICSGDFINITLTPDVANTVATWTVSAPGTVTGASNGAGNLIFQTLFNNGFIPETVTYTVTPKVNGCNGTPIIVSAVVNPKPKFVGLPPTVTVCHGGTLNVPLTSTVAGTTFDWVVDDPSGLGVPVSGSGNVINQPMTNTTGSQASLTYTITPTGPGNCPGDQKLIIVTVSPQISAQFLNASSSICKGSSEFLIIEIQGQAPFQIVYNDGTSDITLNNAGNVKVVQVVPAVTTTYTIKSIKDALNCSFLPVGQTVTVTVGETDANFSIVGPASSCGPYLATFQFNQVAGTEYTWQWFDGSPDDVFLAATTIPNNTITHTFTNPNPNAAITYKVTLRTQLPAPFPGCFKTTTKNVTVFPSIITNAFPDRSEICSGESIQFFNQSFGATSHRWFYRVQGTATEIDIRTTPTVNYNFVNTSTSNPIIYEVVYQANNGNCPAADVVIPITVYRAITAGFNEGTVPPFIGGNSAVTFTNTSAPIDVTQFRYEWTFGLNSTPATGTGAGPFSVNYSSPGPRDISLKVVNIAAEAAFLGCESTFTKTINIPLLPLVAAFTADPVRACFPSDITVLTNTSTGDVMDWRVVDSNGRIAATSNAPLPVFRITNPGIYSIFLTTSNSLTGQVANTQQDNFEVFDNPVASFDLRPTTVYVPDTELTTFNFSIGATDYDWDFGDGGKSVDVEPVYVYKVEGAYDVRLIARNDHGQGLVCTDTLIRKVTAKQGGVTKVPNAFTPNPNGPSGGNVGGGGSGGNGTFNDVFLPIVKGAEEFNMQIFDRWGNLIFESNSANVGWDGYNEDGKLMPAGVYVYKLTIRLSDGQRSTQIGDVTMIR